MRAIKTTTISILAVGLLAGSAVGVAAQDEPSMEPAEVTGRAVQFADISMPETETTADGILVGDDFVFSQIWDTSDPRLRGEVTYAVNWRFDPDSGTAIDSATYEAVNDGGSWLGDARSYTGDTVGHTTSIALNGRDGYEGLTAHVVIDWASEDISGENLRGVIFPSVLPPMPEPYVAE